MIKWVLMFWLTAPTGNSMGYGETEYASLEACHEAVEEVRMELRRKRMFRGVVDDHLTWACYQND